MNSFIQHVAYVQINCDHEQTDPEDRQKSSAMARSVVSLQGSENIFPIALFVVTQLNH